MKYRAVYRTGGEVELHGAACREWDQLTNYYMDELFEADNVWEAAMEAWADSSAPDYDAVNMTNYFPCLAPRAAPARRVKLPFDPENSTDEEVVEAVIGKRIRWVNSINGRPDEARLYPAGPHYKIIRNVSIETHPHKHTYVNWAGDERILNFISMGIEGAFRAARLSAITYVGK